MFDGLSSEVRVRIDATSNDLQALAGASPYAVGRIATGAGRSDAATVLVRGAHAVDTDAKVSSADVIALPRAVDPSTALLVAPVAMVLSLWETLQLELGEVAVWTGGSPRPPAPPPSFPARAPHPLAPAGPAGHAGRH